jgi:cytochrome c biogenesis protein CcmG, thiol:disulfide interchange protein DsbE
VIRELVGQRRLLLAVLGVVVLLVVGFVIRAETSTSSSSKASPAREALIAAAALPNCPTTTGSDDRVAGTLQLPRLTLPCLGDGPSVDLAKLTGPLVLNLWAGTCTECRVEAPFVRSFAAAAKGKVAVLGIVDGTYPGESWDDALDASRGLGLHYPSVFDAKGQLVQGVRAIGIPVSLLIRPNGTIAYEQVGVVKDGQLEQLVKQYLGITVVPAVSPVPAASGS